MDASDRRPKRSRSAVAVLGAVGVLALVIVFAFGALFYFGFVQRGGVYDGLRARLAQSTLNSLVPAIEFYKLQHGTYPESLDQLRKSLPKDSITPVFDPTITHFGTSPKPFFYERVGSDHYYLRGVGADGIPFTPDDILPDIDPATRDKTGLLIAPPALREP